MDPHNEQQATKSNYGIERTTLKGEKVKSLGEKSVADYLYQRSIRYTYEKTAKTWVLGSKISAPDFYLEDHKVYVEYWGLIGLDNLKEELAYEKKMNWKRRKYHESGIKFISIYSWDLDNLESVFPRKFREVTGKDLTQSTPTAA